MSFIEALVRLRICLFRCVFCRRESSKTCHFSTVFTLLLLTMVSVSHIYCGHRARFHCVCLNHRGCLIWGKFVKKNLKANLPSSTHALFSDKACSFSQSECMLYGNFIIKTSTIHNYNTRSSTNECSVQFLRIEKMTKSFTRIGVSVWNSIPYSVELLRKSKFQNNIKELLLYVLQCEEMAIF